MPSGRACTICADPRLAEIDASERGLTHTASDFGVSVSALQRHRQHVVGASPTPTRRKRRPKVTDDARQIAVETLTALRGRLADCPPGDIPRVANAVTQAAKLLAKVSGQLEISQTQIIRSAPWRQLMERLDEVLVAHPDAAKAWSEALAGMVD